MVVLIQGHFRVDLTASSATLRRQGDYVVWGRGIDHTWEAITDSVVLTIRPTDRERLTPEFGYADRVRWGRNCDHW